MRRGLISWSRAELPEATLDARVRRAQSAMAAAGVDFLAVHCTPERSAGVQFFTGFVPYWNESLLIVPRQGRPSMVVGLSNRVHDWIARNAHVETVLHSPKLGVEAAKLIGGGAAVVAVPDLNQLAAGVFAGLADQPGVTLVDGTALLESVRGVADPAQLSLTARAAAIAHRALAKADVAARDAGVLISEIDGEARRLGAEEVFLAVAADLEHDARLVRLEGPKPLGRVFAVRISVGYKGVWVRMTRTLTADAALTESIAAGVESFAAAVSSLPSTEALAGFASWLVEGCRTTAPLEALQGAMIGDPLPLAAGMIVTVQATIAAGGARVLIGAPVLLGGKDETSALLVVPSFA
jgi:Xaa-Pro aminopeptidase